MDVSVSPPLPREREGAIFSQTSEVTQGGADGGSATLFQVIIVAAVSGIGF